MFKALLADVKIQGTALMAASFGAVNRAARPSSWERTAMAVVVVVKFKPTMQLQKYYTIEGLVYLLAMI